MNKLEFEVLDELYFLTSYADLQAATQLESDQLLKVLEQLNEKKWLKCFARPDQELELDRVDIGTEGTTYWYLANKAGLLAHNSR